MKGLRLFREPGTLPKLVGHRGACDVAPENTLPSFQRAVADGADIVEMDVRLSADGYPVVIHDATVDRTTDGTGLVSSLTLAQLSRLDAGAWFGASFAGARIPTLAEVLAWARGKVGLLLELKYVCDLFSPDLLLAVVRLLKDYDIVAQVAFISYCPRALVQAKALLPDVLAGPMYPRDKTLPLTVWAVKRWPGLAHAPSIRRILLRPLRFTHTWGGDMLSMNVAWVTPTLVEAAHAVSMPVSVGGFAWDYESALAMGLDTLSSNDPGRIRRAYLSPNTQ